MPSSIDPQRSRELDSLRKARFQHTGGRALYPRQKSGAGTVVLIAVAALIIGIVAFVIVRNVLQNAPVSTSTIAITTSTSRSPISFTVRHGDTWDTVANRLQKDGIIPSAFLFRARLRIAGTNGALEAGTYKLTPNMSLDQIISTLEHAQQPKAVTVRFTEGWRMEQEAEELESAGVTSASDFLSVTKSQIQNFNFSFLADRPAGATLEGYLFPDTYDFYKNTPAAEVVQRLLQRFGQVVTPAMQAQARAEGHTLFQVLIVASIVEREAEVPSERPLIAGVYWNRLKTGECMCADPTVQYALGKPGNWWPVLNVQARDLAPDSPYNTYTHRGFPPGPIADPGLASIEAALNPQGTYLYFVAKGDGTHLFSHTLQEQIANEQKVQGTPTPKP
ncbi:MAG: endolytic transglycosylase MltG [Chloroflexi bacterium]|nr:endolytic transglycosylase MltG [Chloroflexota bacterium]